MSGIIKRRYILVSVLMVAITGTALSDDDHEKSLILMEEGKILPLQQILKQFEFDQKGRVIEVELEREKDRYVYEIEFLTDDGRVWEYEIDAANGEILEQELED